MKKAGSWILVAGLLAACNNEGTSTKAKLDSLGKDFDSSAERLWDSTKEKAKDLKGKIEQRLEKRDSAQNKADTINK